jgi:hypothetical protein
MKYLSLLFNLLCIYVIGIHALRESNGIDRLAFLFLLLYPLFEIYVVLFRKDMGDFLSMYFKRRTLEEKMKIDNMQSINDTKVR